MSSVLWFLLFPILIIMYLVMSVAWFTLAVIRDVPRPWLAFVPFLNLYLLGNIGDTLKHASPRIQSMRAFPFRWALLVMLVAWFTLAVIRNLPRPWLAFIPFLYLYLLDNIGDTLKHASPRIQSVRAFPFRWALLLIAAAVLITKYRLAAVPVICYLSLFAFWLLFTLVNYLIYERYTPQYKILFTVLTAVPVMGLFAQPFLILYCTKGQLPPLEE